MNAPAEDWRKHWTVEADRLGMPSAAHSSGFEVEYIRAGFPDEVPVNWCPMVPKHYVDSLPALSRRIGEDALERLYEEASILWREAGHNCD